MILKVELKGGLCNKLFCFFSACDIALNHGYSIAEPDFGWHEKIRFSEIYDIEYFNMKMRQYTNNSHFMIKRDKYRVKQFLDKKIKMDANNLWKISEKVLAEQRCANKIDKSSSMIIVLEALRLNSKNHKIFLQNVPHSNFIALQLRIETDWVKYAENKKLNDGEAYLVDLQEILKMVKNFGLNKDLFFTTGEKHQIVKNSFENANMTASYFYNPKLEYEINAAINFEICVNSTKFIGISRSSFSNLISLRRALEKKDYSYIYNYKGQILKRIDKGLQPKAVNSINKFTKIN